MLMSEALSSLAFILAHKLSGQEGTMLVAPAFGFLLVLSMLRFIEQTILPPIQDGQEQARARRTCRLSMLATGLPLLFFSRYTEHSQLSLPFVVFALLSLSRFANDEQASRRSLWLGTTWLVVAACFHAQVLALSPLVLFVIGFRHRSADWRNTVSNALCAASATIVPCLGLWAVKATEVARVVAGNVTGGVNDRLMMSISPEAVGAARSFGLFWMEHLVEVGNMVLFVAPLVVCLPVVLLQPASRRYFGLLAQQQPTLTTAALGYGAFAFLFEFDLRFPHDVDLMTGLGVALMLWSTLALLAFVRVHEILALLAISLGSVHSWLLIGAFLCTADNSSPHPLGTVAAGDFHGHTPRAILSVNGQAPTCNLREGEALTVELSLPVGWRESTRFVILGITGEVPPNEAHRPSPGLDAEIAFGTSTPGRIFVLANCLAPDGTEMLPSKHAPWISRRLPPMSVTVQAILEGEDGKLYATNAVVVRACASE